MNKLTELAKQILIKAGSATPGPYYVDEGNYDMESTASTHSRLSVARAADISDRADHNKDFNLRLIPADPNKDVSLAHPLDDLQWLAMAANSAVILAKAVIIQQEALAKYSHLKLPTVTDGVVVYSDSYVAREALNQVNALTGEK